MDSVGVGSQKICYTLQKIMKKNCITYLLSVEGNLLHYRVSLVKLHCSQKLKGHFFYWAWCEIS